MSSARTLLSRLEALGVKLWDDNGYLGYSAPAGLLTPSLLAELKENKQVLLQLIHAAGAMNGAPIHPRSRTAAMPVSMAQRRLWFVCQFTQANIAYNMPVVFRVAGTLDHAALVRSLAEIVRRHESLRTSFRAASDGPIQIILDPDVAVPSQVIDLLHLPGGEQETEVQSIVNHEVHAPFDLERGPLLRVSLIKLGPASHVVAIVIHHIVADGWSLGVFLRELATLYGAFSKGLPSPLSELSIQYGDFSQWQWEHFNSGELHRHVSFWRGKLANLPTLMLPTDCPRPAVETFQGSHYITRLGADLTAALKEFSQREGVTLYMTLLAAFQILLARYSNQYDIAVASGTANRSRRELEDLIGFFVNTLVIRTDLTGNPTFRAALQRVREAMIEATEHDSLPFERLVEELHPERSLSYNPLVQVGIILQNFPVQPMSFPGLTLTPAKFEFRTAKLDLMLLLTEVGSELEVVIEYNTGLFGEASIRRLAERFETLLSGIVGNCERSISDLPLLPESERAQVLVNLNRTETPFSDQTCIHHLFERQAERTPRAEALVHVGRERTALTYERLNTRADRLARHLRTLGVGPETRVGLCLKRSPDLIVCLLAILKAGGAYVPLDPASPPDRLVFMLADSCASVLITESSLQQPFLGQSARLLLADEEFEDAPVGTSPPQVTAENLAYMIYTSGSTGQPKGVLVEHRALCNSIESDIRTFGTGPGTRFAHATNFHFDPATSHMFMTLCAGGTLYLLPTDLDFLNAGIPSVLRDEAITHCILMVAPLSTLPAADLPSLKVLGTGAEACPAELVARWSPGRRFFNIYGPTETAITATIAECVPDSRAPVIGRPIANLQAYILDPAGQPVPIGVAGELHIAGVGLARGYHDRPALTAEKFIPNPFGPGRLYRTGDLVRWVDVPGGTQAIQFLGRIDNQVKIRGFRIELEEVERALRSSGTIKDAVATVCAGPSGDGAKTLVAYFTPADDQNLETLRDEHVEYWRRLHETGLREPEPPDLAFDTTGWKSSYTGDDIPAVEMRSWVESTVSRILALEPRHVLEIGAGRGLLLSRIAPLVDSYWATDLSPAITARLQKLKATIAGLDNVTILTRPADNFEDFAEEQFDTVVLSSVVQYFPSVDYLISVLKGVFQVLKPGGTVFLGDVRSLCLLEAFHASVELSKAPGSLTMDALRSRVQRAVRVEGELVMDPRFFTALRPFFPRIAQIEIEPKRVPYRNELSLFRYDVTLRTAAESKRMEGLEWHDWCAEGLTPERLTGLLSTRSSNPIAIGNVPNALLREAVALLRRLGNDCAGTVQEWRSRRAAGGYNGCEPETFYALAEQFSRRAHLSWAAAYPDGAFDVILIPNAIARNVELPEWRVPVGKELSQYANNPLRARVLQQLGPKVRQELREKLPHYMIPSVMIALPALPMTSAGKVDRKALPPPDVWQESGSGQVAPRTANEEKLISVWRSVLGFEEIGIHDNFFELGGDSILSLQIVARARSQGIILTPTQVFEHQTIGELAAAARTSSTLRVVAESVPGAVPLTPMQKWFFAQDIESHHHFNQAILLETAPDMQPDLLRQALNQVVIHHDALSLRFERSGGEWLQYRSDHSNDTPFEVIDLSHLAADERTTALEARAGSLQASLNLSAGPLCRMALFTFGEGQRGRLLWIMHHLIVDAFSWRILLEDLSTAYQHLLNSRSVLLPAKTTSFQQWAERLQQYADSGAVQDELSAWNFHAGEALPVDRAGPNVHASVRHYQAGLTEAETRSLLYNANRAYNTQTLDLLLTALALSFQTWTGRAELTIEMEGHGREAIFDDIDVSRTVGWFTTLFPVRLQCISQDLGASLKAIKQQICSIPHRGIGYGILRYLAPNAGTDWPKPQVSFNYLGRFDTRDSASTGLSFAAENPGPGDGRIGQRTHVLGINGRVEEDRLRFFWIYSANLHDDSTIQRLADGFLAVLKELVAFCVSSQAGGYTPSDFPLVRITQPDLTNLAEMLHGNIEAIYPLTPLQQGLLFHSTYSGTASLYQTRIVFLIDGKLDAAVFRAAWKEVVARNPLLRSLFVWEGREQPMQVVTRSVELPWQEQDWSSEEDAGLKLAGLLSSGGSNIVLDRAPLLSFTLVRLRQDRYAFVWDSHHILLDGWSGPIILKHVLESYERIKNGAVIGLPSAPDYGQYIRWLQQQDVSESAVYWMETLRGFAAPTPLVIESRTPTGRTGHRHHGIQLAAQKTAALKKMAEDHRITLSTVFQGVWALLLNRYSGQDDVVFGAVVSGREANVPGIEQMVGLFINTVPVRARMDRRREVGSWMKELQGQQIVQRRHHHTPLAEIQKWSQLPAGTQLFKSLLVFENYPMDESQAEKREFRLEYYGMTSDTHYPIVISVAPGPELRILFDYDASLFEHDAIARLGAHFEHLLWAIATAPAERIGDLALLTPKEERQVLMEWNATRRELTEDTRFHALFEKQAAMTPDSPAVVGPSIQGASCVTLTYRQVDARANQLAHYLQALGVAPEKLVGVYMSRSVETIVGVLAIFKSGGAYVPLDPAYPTERLAFMLRDSNAGIVLTQTGLLDTLPSHQAQIVNLEAEWETIGTQPATRPPRQEDPDNLAYVIYTSGSRGVPKGVLVSHRNFYQLAISYARAFDLKPDSRILQFFSMNFDGSLSEVAMAWGAGACLHVAEPASLMAGQSLQQIMASRGITHVTLLPGVLRTLSPKGLEGLKTVIVAGEVCPPSLVREWAEGRKFYNAYGPTEITVAATVMECQTEDFRDTIHPPAIGRPIENTETYILDQWLRPVPAGVPGELYIGGIQVTRGYLNQPALTAERFVPDPFSGRAGARLYRTGDLAYYTPQGVIVFLGRLDDQVKVRGYRIEIGEVEAVLNAHPCIREACVTVRHDPSGDNRLVAYWVALQEPAPVIAEIREFLNKSLPAYMVPALYVRLNALPFTPVGKVDYEKLPDPDENAMERRAFVEPRTPVEKSLSGIWARVLGLDRVGLRDDFFDLGGHSLLALNVIAGIRQQFGKTLPVAALFEGRTVEKLANLLANAPATPIWSPVVPIQPNGGNLPFFCVGGLGVHVFYFHEFAGRLGFDQPFYGLQPFGIEERSSSPNSMDDLAEILIKGIQSVQPHGPYHLGGHSAGGRIAFALALELQRRGFDVPLLTILDMSPPRKDLDTAERKHWDIADGLAGYVQLVKRALGERLDISLEHLTSLPEEEAWEYAAGKLRDCQLLPPDSGVNELRKMATVNSEVVRSGQNFVPRDMYRGTLIVYKSSEAMPSGELIDVDGWQPHCANPVVTHRVPGDHMTMLREPHVEELARLLRMETGRVLGAAPSSLPIPSVRISAPPDFPVHWDDPADGLALWTYDTAHYRDPVSPLDFSFRHQDMLSGGNLANHTYGLPFSSLARSINTYVYQKTTFSSNSAEELAELMQTAERKVRTAIAGLESHWNATWLPAIQAHLGYWENYDLSGADLPALLEHVAESRRRAREMWKVHYLLLIPLILAMADFEELYRDLFPECDPKEAYQLLTGCRNKTVEANAALWELSRKSMTLPVVHRVLTESPAAAIAEELRKSGEGRAFWRDIEEYLAIYGQRNDNTYLDRPSWIEDPAPVIQNLRNYLSQGDRSPEVELSDLEERRKEKTREVRNRLANHPAPVIAEFEASLKAARAATALSEEHNFWIDNKITFHLRRQALELGRRLKRLEMMDRAEDVFYLTVEDLMSLSGGEPPEDFRTLVTGRRLVADRFRKCTPPPNLGSFVQMPRLDDALSRSIFRFSGALPEPARQHDELRGIPGSGGRVRGIAKVVFTLADAHLVQHGDILVTPTTLPSWTPFFASVAAVVTDAGGVLSHAAIVAREYNIPAVVGTRTGTQSIENGQWIEVDGDAGVVHLLPEGRPVAAAGVS